MKYGKGRCHIKPLNYKQILFPIEMHWKRELYTIQIATNRSHGDKDLVQELANSQSSKVSTDQKGNLLGPNCLNLSGPSTQHITSASAERSKAELKY